MATMHHEKHEAHARHPSHYGALLGMAVTCRVFSGHRLVEAGSVG